MLKNISLQTSVARVALAVNVWVWQKVTNQEWQAPGNCSSSCNKWSKIDVATFSDFVQNGPNSVKNTGSHRILRYVTILSSLIVYNLLFGSYLL